MVLTDRSNPEDPTVKISRLVTATLAGLAAIPAVAFGHGSMSDPPSRVYQCFFTAKDDPRCVEAWTANPQALYDWTEVNIANAAGRHRELIPDGKLCSAGRDKYASFDRAVAWPAPTLRPGADGKYSLTWKSTAPHATEYYRVYITKPSYDQTRALRWEPCPADALDAAEDRETYRLADGRTLRLIAAPGHTPGNLVALIGETREVFSGDTLFCGGPGATGRSFS